MASVYNDRGAMQAHLGNLRDAFIDYERALQIDGNLPIVYLNRGLLYQQIGEVEKSKKDYQQVFAIAPEVAMASYSKGLAPMTLAQSPALVSIHLERALAHGNLDQIDLALKDIEQALAVDANAESAYLLRGNLYYARKEWSRHEQIIIKS
ncbi:MAG UNVERIFIED_CONTAM: tetratricopeptide repeat protein [Microcystis novacekii LVE1205-3]